MTNNVVRIREIEKTIVKSLSELNYNDFRIKSYEIMENDVDLDNHCIEYCFSCENNEVVTLYDLYSICNKINKLKKYGKIFVDILMRIDKIENKYFYHFAYIISINE